MNQWNCHAYLLTCLTDLHAGSGDSNYGAIDKMVQRDATTNFPTIHGSSLKGALREHFEHGIKYNEGDVTYIFGPKHNASNKNDNDMDQGHYRFLAANLLVLPVRNIEKRGRPFYRAYCDSTLKSLQIMQGMTNHLTRIQAYPNNENRIKHEYGTAICWNGNDVLLGEDVIKIFDSEFRDACNNLPVTARNQLENGQSQNLWYEEFVPRESRFVFYILADEEATSARFKNFNAKLKDATVQIGANATVGMGYCKITELTLDEEKP